ncbi:MAG: hypothetical protein ACJAWO_002574 [Halieaceae bacterium]|jgi:hypothetical protein
MIVSLQTRNSEAQYSVSTEMESKINSRFKDYNDLNKLGARVAVVKNQEVIFKKG